MDVHQRWPACGLGKTVGHCNHRRFLQSEYIPKVRREILEKGLLRRADIAEESRQAAFSQQLIGDVSHALRASLFVLAHESILSRKRCRVQGISQMKAPIVMTEKIVLKNRIEAISCWAF